AYYRSGVQFGALGLQFRLHDFLGIIPGAAGIRHENGLEQSERSDRDQVADEEEGLEKRKSQGGEEHRDEDIQHALLRVLRADRHHFLGVGYRGFLRALQLDVLLDELHRAVGAGGYRLGGSAGEPIDHRAASNDAQQERRIQDRQIG